MSDSYLEFPTALLPKDCLQDAVTVVVVGGARGIGKKIVHRLREVLSAESKIVLTARRVQDGASARAELEACVVAGPSIEVMELDISKLESIKRFTNGLANVDFLICNAGFAYKMADKTPFDEQARVTTDINYYGTKNVILSMLPLIEKSEVGGRVVCVSSFAGQLQGARSVSNKVKEAFLKEDLTVEGLDKVVDDFVKGAAEGNHKQLGYSGSAYATSKTAVTQLVRVLARDHPAVQFYSCCPGLCRTDMAGGQWTTLASVAFWLATWIIGHSAYEGADTPAWLAVSTAHKSSGKFYRSRKESPY